MVDSGRITEEELSIFALGVVDCAEKYFKAKRQVGEILQKMAEEKSSWKARKAAGGKDAEKAKRKEQLALKAHTTFL